VGVRFLLDTHVFLWLLGTPALVPDGLRSELAHPDNDIFVSAVSAMEVATKVRLGKLDPARNLVATWSARVQDLHAQELPISTEHALRAGSLEWAHRDPFDRLLVAQGLVENVTLVTSDSEMTAITGLRVRW
jgi:PIN domain nuclease of toxin-antitoxin system